MIALRSVVLASVIVLASLASGCVVAPVQRRPLVVERPLYRGQMELVAPQAPPVWVAEQVRPRPGYIWARGYWRWDGRRYVAERGHWERARPGYRYVHPHWVRGGNGWQWRAGAWVRG